MSDVFDLDAYCRRVGYTGPRDATLATLRALQSLHPAAIPFENLDSRFGVTPSLAPADLQGKLIGRRRGGYCFEHNTLFRAALEALGFQVESLIARVRYGRLADAPIGGRTHMCLRVVIDGQPWLADVGFGGVVLTAPLRLDAAGPQQTPHELFQLVPVGHEFEQQVRLGDRWAATYRFTLAPTPPIDFEMGNWFVATHPGSIFIANLMVARALPGRRLTLQNGEFTVRPAAGESERRVLRTGAELAGVLVRDFAIDPPAGIDLDAVVAAQAQIAAS